MPKSKAGALSATAASESDRTCELLETRGGRRYRCTVSALPPFSTLCNDGAEAQPSVERAAPMCPGRTSHRQIRTPRLVGTAGVTSRGDQQRAANVAPHECCLDRPWKGAVELIAVMSGERSSLPET